MLSNKNKKSKSGTLSLELESSLYSNLSRVARGTQFLDRNRNSLIAYAIIFLGIGILCHILLKNAQVLCDNYLGR